MNETALAPAKQTGRELSTAHAAATAQYEIESAITVALRFPRNEDDARFALARSCKRSTFAEKAAWSFPRGGKTVSGPSVHLARESARVWGNIRYGFEVVRDDDETIHLRGYAWDVQSNARATQDAIFRKKVQRRNKKTDVTEWVTPDERDLRELINKHGSIAERNCILKLVPSDMIEDALSECRRTQASDVKQDPDAARKKIISAFGSINVSPSEIEAYLGGPLRQASEVQIAELREIYGSIRDGHASWAEYSGKAEEQPSKQRQSYAERRKAQATAAPPQINEDAEPTADELAEIEAQLARESET
jgi:hypothetical protein